MIRHLVKKVLPDRPIPLRVLRGPFLGAHVAMNPRASLRKVLGAYEHELNAWLGGVLPRVRRVLDVGANDGYFTFGCAAVLRRRKEASEILAFEPGSAQVAKLHDGIRLQPAGNVSIRIIQKRVGDQLAEGMITLDSLELADREQTLIKIDIEGAEALAIAGGRSWLQPSNWFLIEVHRTGLLEPITEAFAARGLRLTHIVQRPHWLLGREHRHPENGWLVSSQADP